MRCSTPRLDGTAKTKAPPTGRKRLLRIWATDKTGDSHCAAQGKVRGELDVVTCRNRRRRCYRNMPKSSKEHQTGYNRCT